MNKSLPLNRCFVPSITRSTRRSIVSHNHSLITHIYSLKIHAILTPPDDVACNNYRATASATDHLSQWLNLPAEQPYHHSLHSKSIPSRLLRALYMIHDYTMLSTIYTLHQNAEHEPSPPLNLNRAPLANCEWLPRPACLMVLRSALLLIMTMQSDNICCFQTSSVFSLMRPAIQTRPDDSIYGRDNGYPNSLTRSSSPATDHIYTYVSSVLGSQ
ncbi:hypothetical protein V1515DRAFT_272050 [Lipomyces mesembrius]